MNLAVFGDSHTISLANGFKLLGQETELTGKVTFNKAFSCSYLLEPFFSVEDHQLRLTGGGGTEESKQRLLQTIGPLDQPQSDTVLAVSLGFTTVLLSRMKAWRNFCPWNVQPEQDQQSVSEAVVTAIALKHFEHIISFYTALRHANRTCVAISGPPMRRAEATKGQEGPSETLRIVSRIARAAVKRQLEQLGVHVVAPPAELIDDDGFLRPEFWAHKTTDVHHANPEWGRVMMRQLLQEMPLLPRAMS